MIEISERLELPEKAKVQEIATMLEYGADLGIEGEGRWPSEGPNNESVYDYGSRVADSLQTAVRDGIMHGPLLKKALGAVQVLPNDSQVEAKRKSKDHNGPLLSP